ncbi:hypothetical protein Tco_1077797 [Tanacetum coccineum]
MSTLAEYMIVVGAENRPPMLDKTMYNSWQSHMLLYLKGKKNGRLAIESIKNGPLVDPTIEENGQVCNKKYAELTEQEKLQDGCDVQALNIVLQGLLPDVYALVNHYQAAKDIQDRFKLIMQGTEISYQERECDDPIAYLNKATAFMSTIVASHFPSTNDQLRTSSNPRNQATIKDGKVTVQQVQGRQGQAGQARHCTKPKRPRNSAWFKEKMLLVQAQEDGQVLDEKQLAFLADPGIPYAKAVLMANLSNYDSDVLSEIDLENKCVNESLTAELEKYKERVKTFEQRLYIDLNSLEKLIDSQMDDLIRDRCALKQEIDSLKRTLSKQIKEKESRLLTFTFFKKESKEKENKNMDKEIDLEKKIKELDNIVYKVCQSAQMVHMLKKPQVFYDDTHKQAFGYQNSFYLKKAQRIKPTLYDGTVLFNKHDVISVVDEEETLNFGKHFVPQMQFSVEQAFWLPLSNLKSEQLDVTQTLVEIEVPKELPKVSLVKTSFQKLKNHLASFDKVVKVRTTPDAITEGSWGFEHTKKVLKEEVIPFINSSRVSFKDFKNGLHSELNEVKTVFNQMEAAVDQCSVDKKYFDIQKKELSIDNDRLLDHIICQDRLEQENDHLFELLLSQDIVHICVNSLPSCNDCREMHQGFIDEYNGNLMLKVELAKEGQMVEKKIFDEVVLKCSRLENPPRVLNNRDAHIDYIKHSQEHADTLHEKVKNARALRPLDSNLDSACKIVQRIQEVLVYVKATCPSLTKLTEKLFAVTQLNKNKKVRFTKHATSSSKNTKQVDSHKIQDSNKLVFPSTRMKSYTSASRSQPSGNTKNNRISQTTSSNPKNKVEDHPRSVKSNSNKKKRVIEPICNANVKHTMLNVNSELICVKCNQRMFDANHDVCFLEFDDDVNVCSKSKFAKKSKNKNI